MISNSEFRYNFEKLLRTDDRLQLEIKNSNLSIGFIGICGAEDQVQVIYDRELTDEELISLQLIVTTHDGTPTKDEKTTTLKLNNHLLLAQNEILWAITNNQSIPLWAKQIVDDTHTNIIQTRGTEQLDQRYCIKTSQGNFLTSEEWYSIDNGNGTYSNKSREINYIYSNNKLVKRIEKLFSPNGIKIDEKTIEYYTNGRNVTIEKRL